VDHVAASGMTGELRSQPFPGGSMGPKVDAACRFVELTGNTAAIGALDSAAAMLRGDEGTIITPSGLGSPASS
jgi:carbamate kinase